MNTYRPQKSYLVVEDYRFNKDSVGPFAKIFDKRTKTIGPNRIDDRHIFIDVFPVDGVPSEDRQEEYFAKINDLMLQQRKSGKYYKYANSTREKLILLVKYWIKRLKYPSTSEVVKKLNVTLAEYEFDKCDYVADVVGAGKRTTMPREMMMHYENIIFEGRSYMCISNKEEFLEKLYGDWKKLPPENERIPSHFYNSYIDE